MIATKQLTRTYSNGKGIFNLSFVVKEGEIFGYLGPNGAGNTTTIRHLLGFIKAEKGNCIINKLDCWNESTKIQKVLGYLPGEIAFFDNMTGRHFLDFMRGMKDTKCMKELVDMFELDTSGKIRKMSKGMK